MGDFSGAIFTQRSPSLRLEVEGGWGAADLIGIDFAFSPLGTKEIESHGSQSQENCATNHHPDDNWRGIISVIVTSPSATRHRSGGWGSSLHFNKSESGLDGWSGEDQDCGRGHGGGPCGQGQGNQFRSCGGIGEFVGE
jgi:hypothetical protein